MKIVISIGGSLLTKELSAGNFKKYADVLLKLKKDGHKIIAVCGGGRTCRDYRNIAKNFTSDSKKLDFIGIMATHLNAATFVSALGNQGYLITWKPLHAALKEAKNFFGKKIIVAAGYDVGCSTDYDAAKLAEIVDADLLINASNIDGVYSDDPKKNPAAKKFGRLTHEEFSKIILKNPQSPGEYRLFDVSAARLIEKLKLKTIVVDGTDPQEILRAVSGSHNGTTIE